MKMKQILSLLLCLCLLLSVPVAAQAAPQLEGVTTFVWSGNSVAVKEGDSTAYKIVVVDDQGVESVPETATNSNGDPIYSVPYGVKGELEVGIKKTGGQYAFQGTGTGHIVVKKAATGDATVYLNGLTLTSTITATLAVNKDSTAKAIIHVVEGTENTLSDAAANDGDANPNNLMAENAVMKFKGGSDVTLTGDGTLTLNGKAKNGIKANELLTIEGNGILNVNAKDDGISGENTITVNSGTVNITSQEGDGIKCGADDAPTGDILINGGSVTVDAFGDGMQATANLTVKGGMLDITCYGGANSHYVVGSDVYPSAKGLKAGGTYVDVSNTEVNATECTLTVLGGDITVNAPDDALHSDKDILLTGGRLHLATSAASGDGVHAEGNVTVGKTGGNNADLRLEISQCYKGMEGQAIFFRSGTVQIFATDESVNAANTTGENQNPAITVSGGLLYFASTHGDCMDPNTNVLVTGGTMAVLGSLTAKDPAASEKLGSFRVEGGRVLAIGQSGMLHNLTLTQSYCIWAAPGRSNALAADAADEKVFGGEVVSDQQQVTITDDAGDLLISVAAIWPTGADGSANYVFYSAPGLTEGNPYTLGVKFIEELPGDSNITAPDEDIPSAEYTLGDVNQDESIGASDALMILQNAVKLIELQEAQALAADVTGEGDINASDALCVLQYTVKLIDRFPAEQ